MRSVVVVEEVVVVVVVEAAYNLSARVVLVAAVVPDLEEALSGRSRSMGRDIVEALRVIWDTLDRELVGEAAAR